ncbi:MAG: hypothetical protein ABIW16_02660 [Sphingomicrobium sp.]
MSLATMRLFRLGRTRFSINGSGSRAHVEQLVAFERVAQLIVA